jgi:hypothetical protein
MNKYIATFFSHYDALTFFNSIKEKNIKARLMPVPRKVSASCGTCVSYTSDLKIDFTGYELEALYTETESGLLKVTQNETPR